LVQSNILSGNTDILLVSPEKLSNQEFTENILIPIANKIGLFVVDEAHCISDWGHDFRPDYRRIVRILQALPKNIPVLATTATANNRVVEDIQNQLGESLQIVRGELTRESLQLQNIHLPSSTDRMAWLVENLPTLPGSGIIYVLTVRHADRLTEWLKNQNINAEAYYGSLDSNPNTNSRKKIELENRLLKNEIKVLVATTALSMGFDKPDLGFVIHYQKPASIVHYYQQVGRAGRAINNAYGILLSGAKDDEINNYFINNAFPLQEHILELIEALRSGDGDSTTTLESKTNLPGGKIKNILKFLSLESPSPVVQQDKKWYATSVEYQIDSDKIRKLTEIRYQEQQQMRDYMSSSQCLMTFLSAALDDISSQSCGKCAVCLNRDVISSDYSSTLSDRAIQYLKHNNNLIKPRKRWGQSAATNPFTSYGFSGRDIKPLEAECGRALSLWGEEGWGNLVKQGKYKDNSFDDILVQATIEMVKRWQPDPFPIWVTCVPSLNHPNLVSDFARRLAEGLNLPFYPVVKKIKENKPQKKMGNSYQQTHNLDGVFEIEEHPATSGSVFLVDDMVDSGWTFTVIAALLKQSGSDRVFPLALANSRNFSD
jgi:ATP-dependent DNA helicase RecQ